MNNTEYDKVKTKFQNLQGKIDSKTPAAASEESYRREVISAMKEWAGKWDDPWKMFYDGCLIETIPDYGKCATYGEMRFATKENAKNCIKSVGVDRIKKYYFGIPDDEKEEEENR